MPAMPSTLARYYTPAELGRADRLVSLFAWHEARACGNAATSKGVQEQLESGRTAAEEFQFNTDEVFTRKESEDVILSPRPG